jgi:hypothetical protein
MDSQFNSLIQSYNSNYVQYRVTGNASYQSGYVSAQQGLDSILSQLQQEVDAEKTRISDFYKSGIEQTMNSLQQKNRKLQRGIVSEKDDIVAAEMRNTHAMPSPSPPMLTTTQYVSLGVLGAAIIGLSLL